MKLGVLYWKNLYGVTVASALAWLRVAGRVEGVVGGKQIRSVSNFSGVGVYY